MVEVVKIGMALPDEEIIGALQALLEKAKKGEVRELMFACVFHDEISRTYFSSGDYYNRLALLSRLTYKANVLLDNGEYTVEIPFKPEEGDADD